jgi:hypothetical protein
MDMTTPGTSGAFACGFFESGTSQRAAMRPAMAMGFLDAGIASLGPLPLE